MNKIKLYEDISWRGIVGRIALVICTIAIIVWAMPGEDRFTFKVEQGRLWHYADFTAPFDFPIYKSDDAIKAERDTLMKHYEPYYDYKSDVATNMILKLTEDFKEGIPGLPPNTVQLIAQRLKAIYETGVLSAQDYNKLTSDTTQSVMVVNGKQAVSTSIANLYSPKTAYEQLFNDPQLAAKRLLLQRCNLSNYITANLTYDQERSESSLKELMASVPLAIGIVQRGQKIVDRGEVVDEKKFRIIDSFIKENESRNASKAQLSTNIIGQLLYVSIIIVCLTLFISIYRHDYFERPRSIAMLYSLIVGFTVLAETMVSHNVLHVYIVPFAMVAIFVRVFMDSHTAFMAHTMMVLLVASVLQHPFEFIAIQEVAGLAAIYSLHELSSRSQLFKTALIVTLCAIGTNLAIDWMFSSDLKGIDLSEFNYLIISGGLVFCSYPLLYLFEKLFGFISNITLIELSDMNKDLLRRMSEVAPGTFNHSIQVGNLAAEIANKIGAKAQLVRTGALYHDIGKIQNPIYFTENQSGVNPHNNMNDIESAQMIISHVTEGLRLAEKYNLPDVIKEFIATHHGQGKAKYFYVKYKNEHPDDNVDELLFTYPGPNPFTREQAILMMADAVEAASRSLPDYTEKSIRDLVNRILDSQVADGYFRECPITFRDIAYAKTVLIEKLKTIYHTRISYPELKKTP